jgi:4'-phosphopantetheinyl transferase
MDVAEHEIHVWLAATREANDFCQSCYPVLSAAEQERARRFKFKKDEKLFTVAHAALRSLLARYLSVDPTRIEFTIGPQGKPRLAADSGENLWFNLSHSGDLAVIALASREVGVDVERIKENFGFEEVAEHFFTAREVEALRALPSPLQRRAFYRCWTCKEALLKAKGTGLSGELDEVQIVPDGRSARIDANVPGWWLKEIDVGDGYAAAVVSAGGPAEVQIYRWVP